MNCCNDAGKCTNGPNCAVRATRVETRTAPANGIHFAPGAIEHHTRPVRLGTPAQRRELLRWAAYLGIAIVLVVAAIGAGSLFAHFSARWAVGA